MLDPDSADAALGQVPGPRFEMARPLHRTQQRGNVYGREVAKRVADRVGENDAVVMSHGTAGINDVRNIALAFRELGSHQGLFRAAEHSRRVLLVEENRADRILSYRRYGVRQQQPALLELDWRSAIADLDEFPWELWLEKGHTLTPRVQIVRANEV